VPLYLTKVPDATCLGTAIAAAAGAGCFADVRQAAASMVQITSKVEPRAADKATYDFLYERYVGLYPPLRDTIHDLAERTAE